MKIKSVLSPEEEAHCASRLEEIAREWHLYHESSFTYEEQVRVHLLELTEGKGAKRREQVRSIAQTVALLLMLEDPGCPVYQHLYRLVTPQPGLAFEYKVRLFGHIETTDLLAVQLPVVRSEDKVLTSYWENLGKYEQQWWKHGKRLERARQLLGGFDFVRNVYSSDD